MMGHLGELRRSHLCAQINQANAGNPVTVMGWVNRVRKLGQLIFITLRDYTGLLQIVVNEGDVSKTLFEKAMALKSESVIAVSGSVALRGAKDTNPDMETGRVEIIAEDIRVLSPAEPLPFQIADEHVSEHLRLKYRYLDLRRGRLQHNLRIRSKAAQIIRDFFAEEGFVEIETPMLTNSSPEGARDYLVPSRVKPGSFYALPQSPQILKQILMVAGMDKYYQIARCLRDEDLRADRQPEFTQVDMEMSFVAVDDILALSERLISKVFKEVLNCHIPLPIERMTYDEAMARFGSDKPDLRFSMELVDISGVVKGGGFNAFDSAIEGGGSVRGIKAEGCGDFSRKQIDSLAEYVKTYRAKGLSWISIQQDGAFRTSLSKFFSDDQLREIARAFCAKEGDLILICADSDEIVLDALGNLRCEIARRENLTDGKVFRPLWITEFPLLEWSLEDGRYYAKHHPFTAPMEEDLDLLESNPKAVRAKAYDLVINGYETGGGSIRIHRREIQKRMFELLGFTEERIMEGFGHLIEAFKYGVPPHGGMAFGLDRIVMLLCETANIRDVIAFPKQQDASCPLTGAPGPVYDSQLKELSIQTNTGDGSLC